MIEDLTVEESYQWCVEVARTEAKNFYYSFLLLSRPKREAICAIYAFMRYCDDLSDDEGITDRALAIARWRDDLENVLNGRFPAHPLWPAFADTVVCYDIPHRYFFDMIDGISSDLEPRLIQTFSELYDYCYHVASVVGLTVIHIFGFDDPKALELAEKCGIAFQLTNILRDVREDYEKNRVYIPMEEFVQFGVSPATLISSDGFLRLMAFEAERARYYYNESAPLIQMIHPRSRPSLKALIGIYSRLLERIVESNYDVLTRRIRVPTWEKLGILAKSKFM